VAGSKRWLIVAFVLIAIVASLEYMPRNVLLRVAIPADASFPLNDAPTGTSILWSRIEGEGYETAIVYGLSGLAGRLEGKTDVVYLVVAGDNPVGNALEEASQTIDYLVASGVRVHMIMLDEAPNPVSMAVLDYASTRVCGVGAPEISQEILNSTIVTIRAVAGGREWVLPTGYTGYLIVEGEGPLTSDGVPTLPYSLGVYEAIAAAWPYPDPPYTGAWYILGARCTGARGSITVIADSTIAINLAAQTVPNTTDFIVELIRDVAPDPNATLVVADEQYYAGGGDDQVNLLLRLHPSVLLLAIAQVYREAETAVLAFFARDRLLWLIILAASMVLLSATWLATPLSNRFRAYREKAERRLRPLLAQAFGGSWEEAYKACRRAREAVRIVPRPSQPRTPVEEHVLASLGRVESTCRVVEGAILPLRYLPVWRWAVRRVRDAALTALALSGVLSVEEAERLLES